MFLFHFHSSYLISAEQNWHLIKPKSVFLHQVHQRVAFKTQTLQEQMYLPALSIDVNLTFILWIYWLCAALYHISLLRGNLEGPPHKTTFDFDPQIFRSAVDSSKDRENVNVLILHKTRWLNYTF